MNVASPDTVFLFNYRGSSEELNKLVFISGRRDPSGQLRDGAKVLKNILDDAVENHKLLCLKIPRKVIIKLKSRSCNH